MNESSPSQAKQWKFPVRYGLALAVLLGVGGAFLFAAQAEEGEGLRSAADPVVAKECSACHMAYRARWLPADAWRRIMAHLDDHFGEDASLAPEVRDQITAYLVAHARKPGGEAIRITETRWWKHRHNGEISAAEWTRAGSPANCGGCHGIRKGKKRGFFESLFGDDS